MTREEFHQKRACLFRLLMTGHYRNELWARCCLELLEWSNPDEQAYIEPCALIPYSIAEDFVAMGKMDKAVLDQSPPELDLGDLFKDMFKPQYGWMMPIHPDHF